MTEQHIDAPPYDLPAEEFVFDRPDVEAVITALSEAQTEQKQAVSATLVYGLSELSAGEWQRLEAAWQRLSSATKRQIMRRLNESSEALFELSYRELGLCGLRDDSAVVRVAAVELLWTDESEQTMGELISLATRDPSVDVRTVAVKALGRFILLGEYGNVSEELAHQAQEVALRLHRDKSEPLELRRRALEALANSSHPQAHALISEAYAHGNHDLKISAIFAMGRTCNRAWQDILLDELDSHDNEAVYEATSACGQIQLEDSVPRIGELALSDDREIKLSAIWALGEIGGRRALEILSQLSEVDEDEETAAVLEVALDTAGFQRRWAGLDLDNESE